MAHDLSTGRLRSPRLLPVDLTVSQLTPLGNNYRSHSGLLKVAASVVELLQHFFPNSIDPLDPDQGV